MNLKIYPYRRMPSDLGKAIIDWSGRLPSGTRVCGGFIRDFFAREKPNDMDLFFAHQDAYDECSSKIQKGSNVRRVVETERALTVLRDRENKIQLIKPAFSFGSVNQILSKFDFTVCAAGVSFDETEDGIDKMFCYHPDFFEHLASKKLVYMGNMLPVTTVYRAMRFVKRGYDIDTKQFLKIIRDVVNLDVRDGVEWAKHTAVLDSGGLSDVTSIPWTGSYPKRNEEMAAAMKLVLSTLTIEAWHPDGDRMVSLKGESVDRIIDALLPLVHYVEDCETVEST